MTASGDQMKIVWSSHTIARCNGRKSEIEALIAQDLAHNMVISWKNCVSLGMITESFPLPPSAGFVNSIDHTPQAENLERGNSH